MQICEANEPFMRRAGSEILLLVVTRDSRLWLKGFSGQSKNEKWEVEGYGSARLCFE